MSGIWSPHLHCISWFYFFHNRVRTQVPLKLNHIHHLFRSNNMLGWCFSHFSANFQSKPGTSRLLSVPATQGGSCPLAFVSKDSMTPIGGGISSSGVSPPPGPGTWSSFELLCFQYGPRVVRKHIPSWNARSVSFWDHKGRHIWTLRSLYRNVLPFGPNIFHLPLFKACDPPLGSIVVDWHIWMSF